MNVITRHLASWPEPTGVLEALKLSEGAVRVFGDAVRLASLGHAIRQSKDVAGGTVSDLVSEAALPGPAHVPEPELFAGLNTVLSLWQGTPVDAVRHWMTWHAHHHGLEAVVLLAVAPEDDGRSLAAELAKEPVAGLQKVLVVLSASPLGKLDLPPMAHPFNAPDAPGKVRMTVPVSDPFRAPFGAVILYEAMRARFLTKARAVANVDVTDYLAPPTSQTVFDAAYSAPHGIQPLEGIRVFPWQIRGKAPAGFHDHVCRRFDAEARHMRWAVAPERLSQEVVWRMVRVPGVIPKAATMPFWRAMCLAHPKAQVSEIVPKSSLVEVPELITLAEAAGARPSRPPKATKALSPNPAPETATTTVVTCMKNEGPFILDWIAHQRAIGVTGILVYSNDCTDGTDALLDLLAARGLIEHRQNPFKGTGLKPQHAALQAAERELIVQEADWLISADVDEYLNIHLGEGRLADLYAAVPKANMISATWRLFGNADVDRFQDRPVAEQFVRCAPQLTRKPHQAWGFKTLFRNIGIFRKLGVHRPKGLKTECLHQISWVNGSGKPLPEKMYRNAWRSTTDTYGYGLVTLNHYAVRSSESFLVKRERGRVNHVDRDQGLNYWFRMNNNAEEDRSIARIAPAVAKERALLLADPRIAAAHQASVAAHRDRIEFLKADQFYGDFFSDLTSPRMRRLSRLHHHFGANVFLRGPETIPNDVVDAELSPDFFYTVPGKQPSGS
ncbi:MAG: glycosyltransferase family 2 protein [Pseudomonadota bacterium]